MERNGNLLEIGIGPIQKYKPVTCDPQDSVFALVANIDDINQQLARFRREAISRILELFKQDHIRVYRVWFNRPDPVEDRAEYCTIKITYDIVRKSFHIDKRESYLILVGLDDNEDIYVETTNNDRVYLGAVDNPENVLLFMLKADPFYGGKSNGDIYY